MKFNTILATLLMGVIFILSSCNKQDDEWSNYSYVALKIDSISMPDSAQLGSAVAIRPYYQRMENCEQFYGFDYQRSDFERTVLAVGLRNSVVQCGDTLTQQSQFTFQPLETGTYNFRFWNGRDAEGDNMFVNEEIVIY
ncbi:MAG: hypothetical protein Q4F57_07795 [Weeksellaceae bacterium]|nr:hypothetical protein [Weeksellaceae bacterium]